MTQHQVKIGVAICTPIPFVRAPNGSLVKENITVDWHRARMGLMQPTNIITYDLAIDGQEVGLARCLAAEQVQKDGKAEFLFFLDYDVLPPRDTLSKLMRRAREFKDYDIFAGVYCAKSEHPEPLIYMRDGEGPYWDWSIGDLVFDVASVHMGCTLIRASLFDRVDDQDQEPWFKSTNKIEKRKGQLVSVRGTEDIWFCQRAREEANAKIMVDTSILCAHQDNATHVKYGLPVDSKPAKAKWREQPEDELKRALDIGAGGQHRKWDGYQTETTDIRSDVGADYCMDSLDLNLPDDHYDLVASSHHLEHLPRWRQEEMWEQMFRICKPGGRIEHIVPNLEWAAEKIKEGEVDEHVFNVLYGAQEQHAYERELNTHFFGYTPAIGISLAEQAGFVDVEAKAWKQDEQLGYNLIITGRKPLAQQDEASLDSV